MSIGLLARLAALTGAIFITLAALSSAFNIQLARRLKGPFTKIHHPLAISGLIFIVVHPVLIAWQFKNTRILIPNFDSWRSFWTMAGCPALILFVLAVLAALLIKKLHRYWRWGHWLIYPAMLMAGIHGLRLGQDLKNPALAVFLGIFLVLALSVFFYKRLKNPINSKPTK